MTDSAPVAWQDIDGQRQFVEVSYVLLGNNEVGFTVGDYDHSQQLVIDPTLTWNTFLGGGGDDYAQAIAVDGSGNVYVAGYSSATWGSPVRAFGAVQRRLRRQAEQQRQPDLEYVPGRCADGPGQRRLPWTAAATSTSRGKQCDLGSPVRAFTAAATTPSRPSSTAAAVSPGTPSSAAAEQTRAMALPWTAAATFTWLGTVAATWGSPVRAFTAAGKMPLPPS